MVGLDEHLFEFDTTGKTTANMGWTPESFIWTPTTTGLYTITFRSDTDTQFGPALDDVDVSAVPLPATLPLFGSGLVGLGWLSRRRRKTLA